MARAASRLTGHDGQIQAVGSMPRLVSLCYVKSRAIDGEVEPSGAEEMYLGFGK